MIGAALKSAAACMMPRNGGAWLAKRVQRRRIAASSATSPASGDDLGAERLDRAHAVRVHSGCRPEQRDVPGAALGHPAGDQQPQPAETASDEVGRVGARS